MSGPEPLRLFEGYGIELEYMIVDANDLSVRPVADELLASVGGGYEMEVELGPVAWSNELALHVIEMKTNGPAPTLQGLGATFQEHVGKIQRLLAPMGARLLPSAMHPWMDPHRELKLWPHEDNAIYRTFDRIFDCRGHGWANLQSMHINLPFADDDELGRLHAAIRLVLPLLPGLAASSPFVDGDRGAFLDTRLDVYRNNARRVPSVMGEVIPERVYTQRDYEERLLGGIYRDLSPLDPDGVLQHEWVNARGCIARFDRMALEIRLLDLQECPMADLAVAGAVTAAVRALVEERWCSTDRQRQWDEHDLAGILSTTIRDADAAIIEDGPLLEALGHPEPGRARLSEVWQRLIEDLVAPDPCYPEWEPALSIILSQGCLGRRLVRAAGEQPTRADLSRVYGALAECLSRGVMFQAPA